MMEWAEFFAAHACTHLQKGERKQQIKRAGAVRYFTGQQCLACGVWTKNPGTHLAASVTHLVERDDALYSQWHRRLLDQYQSLATNARIAENLKWWQWYDEYLLSPQWRAKRKQVLLRSQGQCEGCAVRSATQVHHTTYAHVGYELLFELVALCDVCHAVVHPDKEEDE